MKKGFLLAMMTITMTSCFTTKLYEPHWSAAVMDYSMLTNKGIYVNESDKVNFEYQTLASVMTKSVGGYISKKVKNVKNEQENINDVYYRETKAKKNKANGYNMIYISPSYNEALEVMVNKLEEIGANGIINLKISEERGETYDAIKVTGTAIKR